MIYLSGGILRDMPTDIGVMLTPHKGNNPRPGQAWAADNGCFARPDLYSDDGYLRWLDSKSRWRPACMFATAPDVVADATATLERSLPMLRRIRDAGYPPALVAQDGMAESDVPWSEIDFLFLGGSTEWKIGPRAADLCLAAIRRGVPTHMGRVNSLRRLRIAEAMGCVSVDGTFVAFAPDINIKRVSTWLRAIDAQRSQRRLPLDAG